MSICIKLIAFILYLYKASNQTEAKMNATTEIENATTLRSTHRTELVSNEIEPEMTVKIQIPALTFLGNSKKNMGECSIVDKKRIYFPFFLMGCCGDPQAVISWDRKREILPVPKKMDYKWFQLIANKLKANPYYDWDWCSFAKNILRPNREHLKVVLNLDDKGVDRLLMDGYVFLNHFDDQPEDEGYPEWEEMRKRGEVGYWCNFKNFLEHPDNLEY